LGEEQKRGANALAIVAGAMSPAQLAEAQERARAWMDQHKQ
jgi:hypothetical protein